MVYPFIQHGKKGAEVTVGGGGGGGGGNVDSSEWLGLSAEGQFAYECLYIILYIYMSCVVLEIS